MSPSSSGLLPMPGAPSSSWAVYRARLLALCRSPDMAVLAAFWLFGLINNVLYVIILSAAQDLVGSIPKGVVLLADVVPSFLTKLVAPYFVHRVPYAARVPLLAALSATGMLAVAAAPSDNAGGAVGAKLGGVVLASLSSGGGELSFLGLTHYYGPGSLAAWGSGTGAAGLVGAGLYVALTDGLGLGVRGTLLASACLPAVLLVGFFVVLPRGPLRRAGAARKEYRAVPGAEGGEDAAAEEQEEDEDEEDDGVTSVVEDMPAGTASSSLLAPEPPVASATFPTVAHPHHHHHHKGASSSSSSFYAKLRRARSLFFPYMLPLLLVYVAEYTINQGVAPTLLFPLDASPFDEFRAFYPFYGFLYQLGVFVSRSSTPFVRVRRLYVPALLQVANLLLLGAQALFDFLPSVYVVFAIVLWEGLLGGAVYVNTFAEIMERVPLADREFSLGATSVSDSGGICVAGVLGIAVEVWLCNWQVRHGRDWCRRVETG